MSLFKKGKYDLYMYQGDTGNIIFSGIPIDSNYTLYLQINKGNEMVLEKKVESNNQDKVIFTFSAEETNKLEVMEYTYALKLCNENGTEDTVIPSLINVCSTPSTFINKAKFSVYPKLVEGTING